MLQKIFLSKLILFFLIITSSHSLENKIILKINRDIITSQDIQNEIRYLSALSPKIMELNEKEIYEISKKSLVREKIKKIQIFKNNSNARLNDDFLENIIEKRYVSLGLKTRDEFIKYLEEFNIEIKTIIKKIEIEALWNQLIFYKFSKNVKINKKDLQSKIQKNKNFFEIKEFFLKEILFNVEKGTDLSKKYKQITESISNTGFENTASKYSVSDSAKTGGILGWINKNSLSSKINEALSELNVKDYSKPIVLPGGFLILQISEERIVKKKLDLDKELKKMVDIETNRQLNQFSNIYFNKAKKEISINEI